MSVKTIMKNKHKIRLLFLTLGPKIMAGSRTRAYGYISHLRKKGIKCKVINYHSTIYIKQGIKPPHSSIASWFIKSISDVARLFNILRMSFYVPFYDIIIVQKVVLPRKLRNLLYRLNKIIVIDFDDATFILKNEPSTITEIFSNAKLVFVENDYNRQLAQKLCSKIEIITGPIDTDKYYPSDNDPIKEKVTVGWIGHPATARHLLSIERVYKGLSIKYPEFNLL